MDEVTRAGLARAVAMSRPSLRVRAVLERWVAGHGAPQVLRRDCGPEGMALAGHGRRAPPQRATLAMDPGCPGPNGYGARCTRTVCEAWVTRPVVHAVAEARVGLTVIAGRTVRHVLPVV
jgi:hypothetical protein